MMFVLEIIVINGNRNYARTLLMNGIKIFKPPLKDSRRSNFPILLKPYGYNAHQQIAAFMLLRSLFCKKKKKMYIYIYCVLCYYMAILAYF